MENAACIKTRGRRVIAYWVGGNQTSAVPVGRP